MNRSLLTAFLIFGLAITLMALGSALRKQGRQRDELIRTRAQAIYYERSECRAWSALAEARYQAERLEAESREGWQQVAELRATVAALQSN